MFRFVAILGALAFASAEIIQPCADDLTYSCVADYLTKVAGCEKPTISDLIDSVKTSAFKFDAPSFGTSVNRYDNTFEGLAGAKIIAFFADTEAGKTLWSIEFPILVSLGREEIWYHNVAEIDTELETAFKSTYSNVRFTAQWEGVDKITVGTARSSSKIDSVSYDLEKDWPELYAEVTNYPDDQAAAVLKAVSANPEVLVNEESIAVGLNAGIAYWNTYLCGNLDPSVLLDQYD